jgi:hypothetical protein
MTRLETLGATDSEPVQGITVFRVPEALDAPKKKDTTW